jgi:hypothetical protein
MKTDTDYPTVGNDELCAWSVADSACWVQCRSSQARKLIQKAVDSRVVARGWPYLVTLEVKRTFPWVSRLVEDSNQKLNASVC